MSSRRTAACLSACLLLCACAGGFDAGQPVRFEAGSAVPVDIAVPHLETAVDERITVTGIPRQREGQCRGTQPLTRSDWMLTGKKECLWVSGRVPGASLLDVRDGISKEPVTVTGRLIRTESNQFVLKAERAPPPARKPAPAPVAVEPPPASGPMPAPVQPVPEPAIEALPPPAPAAPEEPLPPPPLPPSDVPELPPD